jgi:hypothetical protein
VLEVESALFAKWGSPEQPPLIPFSKGSICCGAGIARRSTEVSNPLRGWREYGLVEGSWEEED